MLAKRENFSKITLWIAPCPLPPAPLPLDPYA